MVDAGVPLDRMASLLGHESVDTARVYTISSEQGLQWEVERVAMVQGKGGTKTPQEREGGSRARSDRRHSTADWQRESQDSIT
jgi:hypothetical protein